MNARWSGYGSLLIVLALPGVFLGLLLAPAAGFAPGAAGFEPPPLYLPVVVNNSGVPAIPTLNDIENADGDGTYTIQWSISSLAVSYTLEEDDNVDFSSPSVVHSGAGITKTINGNQLGNYFYHVRAENGMGPSEWSEVKSASVTSVPQIVCETHSFGTVGFSLPIQPSGAFDHFTAVNTMLIETVEVKSVLKGLFPVNIYVAVGVNGEQLANKTHYVISNVFTPYYINKDAARALHAGDDIYYYISKSTGSTEAWIGWGNYVKLCGR